MIVGFGTGRCGTVSLSEWLDTWHEHKTTGDNLYFSELDDHAKTKWLANNAEKTHKFEKTYGDISLDHINSLDYWLSQKRVTLICLMRDRDEFVHSLANYRTNRIWKRLFPQFDFDTEEGIGEFWDWYYDTILEHEDKFIIISPDQLPLTKNEGKWRRNQKT